MRHRVAGLVIVAVVSMGSTASMDPWLNADTQVFQDCFHDFGDTFWDVEVDSYTEVVNWSEPGWVSVTTDWEAGCVGGGCDAEDSYELTEPGLSVSDGIIDSGWLFGEQSSVTAAAWSSHYFIGDGFDDDDETHDSAWTSCGGGGN